MKKIHQLLTISLLFIIACSPGRIYEKHQKIENNYWNRSNDISFEFVVKDTSVTYDIFIAVRHTTNYPYKNLVISTILTTPGGEERLTNYDLQIRDADGKALGDGLGDLWDINIPLRQGFKFYEKGTCRMVIENRMPKVQTPGIREIGLIVEKN